jgi:predicted porin
MKKSLLAVAAIGAFASAAQAQSSVTVYGILDVGYIGSNASSTQSGSTVSSGAGGNYSYAGNSAYPNSNLKTTSSVLGQSGEQTSRLGFKGNEDLGGGTSAFFTAEFSLYPADANLSGSSNSGLKNRQTFVGLKKNGLGDFAVGTQYSPIHVAVGKTDPGQQNNVVGNVIYQGQSDTSGTTATAVGSDTAPYTVRLANSLTLNTEVFKGLQGHAIVVANNTNTTVNTAGTAGGTSNNNGWGLGADYTWNKFFITANYQAFKSVASATNTAAQGATYYNGTVNGSTASPFAIYPGAGGGTNVQDNQGYVGATYDFGILKAYAQWIQRKATATYNSGAYTKRTAEQIGVRSFITPTIEAWASAGVGNYTPFGQNQPSAHFNAWQLGSNYYLSKRTNLYAIYGQTAQANATYNIYNSTGGVASTGVANLNANSYAIGVRHTF